MEKTDHVEGAAKPERKPSAPMLLAESFVDLDRLLRELLTPSTNKYIKALRLFQIEMAIRFCKMRDGRTPASIKKMSFPVYIEYEAYQRLSAMACARLLHRLTTRKIIYATRHEKKKLAISSMIEKNFLAIYPEFVSFDGWGVASHPVHVEEWRALAEVRLKHMEAAAAPLDVSLRFQPSEASGRKTGSFTTAMELLEIPNTEYRRKMKVHVSESTIRRHWREYSDVSIFCYLQSFQKLTLGFPELWSPGFTAELIRASGKTSYLRQYIASYNWAQAKLEARGYPMRRIKVDLGKSAPNVDIKLDQLCIDQFQTANP